MGSGRGVLWHKNCSANCDAGFPIRYRFDDVILDLRKLQAKTQAQTDVRDEPIYGDQIKW